MSCHNVTVTMEKDRMSQCHSHILISHDECGKVVHRPYSNCISSIGNLMETSLSFSCQLGLGE